MERPGQHFYSLATCTIPTPRRSNGLHLNNSCPPIRIPEIIALPQNRLQHLPCQFIGEAVVWETAIPMARKRRLAPQQSRGSHRQVFVCGVESLS